MAYHFNQPVKKIFFSDNSNKFRKSNFQLSSSNASIVALNGKEVIDAGSESITDVSIKHKTLAAGFDVGHEFHTVFSTGDVLVQTGFYDIYKVEDQNGAEQGINLLSYTFEILGPGHVLFKDKRYDRTATWTASGRERQTFVFFGFLEPVINSEAKFAAVLDPELPGWMKERFATSEPILYKYFNQKLFPLPFVPTIYFSAMQPDTADSSDTSGQIIAGAMAVKMAVNKAEFATENNFLNFKIHSALFAHENVHLWNAHTVQMAQSWMWEGGADTLAQTALYKLKLVRDQEYEWYRKESGLNQCLSFLKKFYVANPNQPSNLNYQLGGAFPYRCGYMIGYVTNLALQKANGSDIFDLWGSLIKTNLQANSEISKGMYLQEVEKTVTDAKIRLALRAWLTEGLTEKNASGFEFNEALSILGDSWQN